MKTRSFLFTLAWAAVLPAISLPSCSEDKPEAPAEVYFSSTAVRTILMTCNSDNTFNDSTCSVGTIRYAGNVNRGTVIATLAGGGDDLLEKYNTLRKSQCLLLPKNNYELLTPSLTIENGRKISEEGRFTLKNIAALDTAQTYLLPVTILSLDATADVTLHELKRTSWWVISSTLTRP
ncbi:MAG: DUF1735 domain-containing protein [Bacteroidales bacterium]|jgi:hypothetical protein|nr:DUF1735 domain-containing protein [Bacteroidales bacterium]